LSHQSPANEDEELVEIENREADRVDSDHVVTRLRQDRRKATTREMLPVPDVAVERGAGAAGDGDDEPSAVAEE
jgi:hypothetical protein